MHVCYICRTVILILTNKASRFLDGYVRLLYYALFQVVANFYGNSQQYNPVLGKSIHWAGGKTEPPLNTPFCGYQWENEECHPNGKYHTILVE